MSIGRTLRGIAAPILAVLTAIGLLGSGLAAQAATAGDPTVTRQATHQYDAGEYARDYKFNDYLASGVTDYDAYRNWVSKNVADNLPVVGGFNGLCTYVLKQGADGHWLAARNLDTSGVMPSIRVRTHPSGGYASVGNAFVMKASNTGDPSETELKASALAAPYFTADGVNEKGVSTALLALNNFSAPTDSSRKSINQFALVRLVLDHAASVADAEQLIRRFNVAPFSASGKTSTYGLHLAVADRTGDLAVFEWQNGGLHVTHPAAGSQIVVNTATWTGAAAKDSRFVKAKNYLDQMTGGTATKDNLLRIMHQLPSSTPIQWSVVYDLNDTTGIQTNRGNTDGSYGETKSFSLDTTPATPDTPSEPTVTTRKATFDPNGGTGNISPITFTPGQTVTAPDGSGFTRAGWTFTGWNTKADGSGQPVKAGQKLPTQASTTDFILYAQWAQDGGTTKPTRSNANVKVEATGQANEYRVSMSVQGTGSSETTRTPTDYIVLIDESGSMSNKDATGTKRSDYVRKALGQLADSILTEQNDARPSAKRDRIAVLHSSQDNKRLQYGVEWHDKASDIRNMTVSEVGDTPWASWLAAMHNQLTLGRSNAQKVGILITDGSPSAGWHDGRNWENTDGMYDSNSELTAPNGGELIRRNEYTRSLKQAERLAKDGWTAFYNIGVDIDSQKCDGNIASGNTDERKMVCLTPQGVDFPKSEYDRTGSNSGYYDYVYWPKTGKVASNYSATKLDRSAFDSPLEGLTRKMTTSGMNAHISTVSGAGLADAISQTLKDVTVIHTMRDLTGTIPLSEWMTPVGLADGKADGITVTRDGKTLDTGYTARYDGKTRKVSTLFTGDLQDGATYTFSFLVRISDKGAASGKMTLPTAVGNKADVAWTDVTSTDGKETTTPQAENNVGVPEAKVTAPIVDGLPGTGSDRSPIPLLMAGGILLALTGAGCALAYRRRHGGAA